MRLQIGDMALIVGGFPENHGREVEIISFDASDPEGNPWEVRAISAPLTGARFGFRESSFLAWAKTSQLMPLRPDSDEVIETDSEVTA